MYTIWFELIIWYGILLLLLLLLLFFFFGKEEISLRTKQIHQGQLQSNQKQPCCV